MRRGFSSLNRISFKKPADVTWSPFSASAAKLFSAAVCSSNRQTYLIMFVDGLLLLLFITFIKCLLQLFLYLTSNETWRASIRYGVSRVEERTATQPLVLLRCLKKIKPTDVVNHIFGYRYIMHCLAAFVDTLTVAPCFVTMRTLPPHLKIARANWNS